MNNPFRFIFQKWKFIYEQKYKYLLILTFLILFAAMVQIGVQTAVEGDFVHRGVSLKGGSTLTFDYSSDLSISEMEVSLQQEFPQIDLTLRTISSAGTITALAIDSGAQDSGQIEPILTFLQEKYNISKAQISVEVMGSALGNSFFQQTFVALGVAFLLMALVVFFYFRIPIPSLAVILCAFSDIVITLAIFNLTGMKLSTAGVAAFLMMVGYSVDTDILLNSRVLKHKEGTVLDRVYGAIKTGMTMTSTTLGAVFVGLLLVESEAIKQIMLIIFIGVLVDIVMTWVQNVGILRWYLESKEKKKEEKISL